MKIKLCCLNCDKEWTMSYFKWVLKNPFHNFHFGEMKDYRKTKCPYCHKNAWISHKKIKR